MKKIFIMIAVLTISFVMYGAGNLEEKLKTEEAVEAAMLEDTSVKLGAYVISYQGKAFIKYPGQDVWNQIVRGVEVKEKSTVITFEGANAKVALKTGTVVDIGEKSKAVFDSLKQFPKKDNLTETSLKIVWGSIYSNVKKLTSGSKYEVKTGSANCGVRGTQFKNSVDLFGNMELTVYDGIVEASSFTGETPVMVRTSEKIKVDIEGNYGTIEKHDEKPPKLTPEEEALVEEIIEGKIDEIKEREEEIKEEIRERESEIENLADRETGIDEIVSERIEAEIKEALSVGETLRDGGLDIDLPETAERVELIIEVK